MRFDLKHFLISFIALNLFSIFAQSGAVKVIDKALDMDTVDETVSYLVKSAAEAEQNCDKRVLYAFAGSVQEQASLYSAASASFAKAASISVDQETVNAFILKKEAKASEKIVYSMLKKTSSILVLDAVRCSLNAGESKTAMNYLNSSVRNSKDEKIQAKIKLYEVWAALCDAQEEKDIEEPVALLKAYSSMSSMKSVMPSVLFTLWYINDDSEAAQALKKKYPSSPEANVVTGVTSLMPTPFWFFVPRKGNAIEDANDTKASSISAENGSSKKQTKAETSAISDKVKRQQVGLFGKKENAESMVSRLKEKGFNAYIEEEKRPSGNIYFIVVVNENDKGTIGMQLKTAGFDCYPIF